MRNELERCPRLLRNWFQTCFSIVSVRHEGYQFKCLANFFFLRFLAPAVIGLNVVGTARREVTADDRRHLVTVRFGELWKFCSVFYRH